MMIRIGTILSAIACAFALSVHSAAADVSIYERRFETEHEFNLALLEFNDIALGDILSDLREFELKDPSTLNREFTAQVIEAVFCGNKDPEVITFLLDWIEFRRTLGRSKNPASGEDELYPALMALKRRGPAVIPDLLAHATAGPRSISYRHRVRSLLHALLPDPKKRKKALVEFADTHPEKEEALSIFDPPIERDIDEVFRIIKLPASDPERIKYFEEREREKLCISVGQWKRMTEEAARKGKPVEK